MLTLKLLLTVMMLVQNVTNLKKSVLIVQENSYLKEDIVLKNVTMAIIKKIRTNVLHVMIKTVSSVNLIKFVPNVPQSIILKVLIA